ncbi:hypothetical protein VNO77_20529 [Canavalia gladiata]|uniref:Uncharacterized protein n=1 Tax=Canavalia gladiata TaxID=3824 RepID=A0AAN9QQN0_CANGL
MPSDNLDNFDDVDGGEKEKDEEEKRGKEKITGAKREKRRVRHDGVVMKERGRSKGYGAMIERKRWKEIYEKKRRKVKRNIRRNRNGKDKEK